MWISSLVDSQVSSCSKNIAKMLEIEVQKSWTGSGLAVSPLFPGLKYFSGVEEL